MDEFAREKAKRHARQQAEGMYDSHYGQDDQYNPDQRDAPNFDY